MRKKNRRMNIDREGIVAGKVYYKNTTSPGNWYHLFFYSMKDIVCNEYLDYHESNNDI
jgi:hypothetical protein